LVFVKGKTKYDFAREAKVLLFDTEVSPNLGWFYGQYETTPIKVEQPPLLLAISWKWLGDRGKAQGATLLDFPQIDRTDDTGIVKELWKLLDEAKVVVAHNGNRFDVKMANAFFLRHGMTPPSPYKTFDTLQTARRFFKFDNNKLDYLGQLLIGEGKTETTYKDCWYQMLRGSDKEAKKAAKLMNTYCQNDTDLLEKIYLKLRPWAHNHPNLALLSGHDTVCPRCGHSGEFRVKSYRYTGTQINALQYLCKHCGAYVTRQLDKEEKEALEQAGKLKSTFRNLTP